MGESGLAQGLLNINPDEPEDTADAWTFDWETSGEGELTLEQVRPDKFRTSGQSFTGESDYRFTGVKAGLVTVSVTATRDDGLVVAPYERTIDVGAKLPEGDQGITINHGDFATNDPHVTISATYPGQNCYGKAKVSNDGGFGSRSAVVDLDADMPWTLVESGSERLPRIVYLRFGYGGKQFETDTYTDDIVLDQTAPTIQDPVVTRSARAARVAAQARTRRVKVVAADDNSGLATVRFSARPSRKGAVSFTVHRKARIARVYVVSKRLHWVQVLDSATNASVWKRI